MDEYLNLLLEQIRCKKARPYIRQELQDHIEDQIDANVSAGMNRTDAEKEAVKDMGDPAKPLICIYAAPTSLCIAGYVQSVMPKNYNFLMAMFVVATVIYIFALIKAIGYLKMPFYPSYAAFTFPFVISAIATKQTMACAANMGHPMPFLANIVLIETIIAVVLVVYTYIRFMGAIFGGNK